MPFNVQRPLKSVYKYTWISPNHSRLFWLTRLQLSRYASVSRGTTSHPVYLGIFYLGTFIYTDTLIYGYQNIYISKYVYLDAFYLGKLVRKRVIVRLNNVSKKNMPITSGYQAIIIIVSKYIMSMTYVMVYTMPYIYHHIQV